MGLWTKLPISALEAEDSGLVRHLTLPQIVVLGVGGTIGAGIFVLTGAAAAHYAGPAVALSFVIAGIGCLFAALCYAELASMIPVSGSAYTYAYATLGELVAWIVGWNLILEYLFSSSAIAVGWSGYFRAAMSELGIDLPSRFAAPPVSFSPGTGELALTGAYLNLPAALVVLAITAVLVLGIRESSRINALFVTLKLAIIALVLGAGAFYVEPADWTPFVPENTGQFGEYGWSGVVRAAGVVFFAYIGFDMVATAAQEAKNPKRDIPLGLMISLGVVSLLYIAMCLVMTGLAPFPRLGVPHPVFAAIAHSGELDWLKPVVSIGIVGGLCSAIFATIYGQTRVFLRMGHDGLIPRVFGTTHPTLRTPAFATVTVGFTSAVIAALTPIEALGELVSIGTLLAFSIVCLGVLVLRRAEPERPRGFRTPLVGFVAPAGIATCAYMMISLPGATWIRFAVWLALGLAVYAFFGRRRSRAGAVEAGTP